MSDISLHPDGSFADARTSSGYPQDLAAAGSKCIDLMTLRLSWWNKIAACMHKPWCLELWSSSLYVEENLNLPHLVVCTPPSTYFTMMYGAGSRKIADGIKGQLDPNHRGVEITKEIMRSDTSCQSCQPCTQIPKALQPFKRSLFDSSFLAESAPTT